jgi:hypothetical protein
MNCPSSTVGRISEGMACAYIGTPPCKTRPPLCGYGVPYRDGTRPPPPRGRLWNCWFLSCVQFTSVAGAVATWYFTLEDDKGQKNLSHFLLSQSLIRTLAHHMGTMAFGSVSERASERLQTALPARIDAVYQCHVFECHVYMHV